MAVNDEGTFTFPIPREQVDFYYSIDGEHYQPVHSFVPTPGRWVGVKFGVFCCHEGAGEGGHADVDYVRIRNVGFPAWLC